MTENNEMREMMLGLLKTNAVAINALGELTERYIAHRKVERVMYYRDEIALSDIESPELRAAIKHYRKELKRINAEVREKIYMSIGSEPMGKFDIVAAKREHHDLLALRLNTIQYCVSMNIMSADEVNEMFPINSIKFI